MSESRTAREVKRVPGAGLAITWSDGERQEIGAETLRRACPCASCQNEPPAPAPARGPKSLRIVGAAKGGRYELTRISAVGNYAVRLEWADGHDTGIYSFEYLAGLEAKV